MTTATDALKNLRDALEEHACGCNGWEASRYKFRAAKGYCVECDRGIAECGWRAKQALSLLAIIEEAMLPEMPKGWFVQRLEFDLAKPPEDAWICDLWERVGPFDYQPRIIITGYGSTPRAAILDAIKEVK